MTAAVPGPRFDHLLLARRHAVEVARFRAFLERAGREGGVFMPTIEHESDDGCCRHEPWPVTMCAMLAGAGSAPIHAANGTGAAP